MILQRPTFRIFESLLGTRRLCKNLRCKHDIFDTVTVCGMNTDIPRRVDRYAPPRSRRSSAYPSTSTHPISTSAKVPDNSQFGAVISTLTASHEGSRPVATESFPSQPTHGHPSAQSPEQSPTTVAQRQRDIYSPAVASPLSSPDLDPLQTYQFPTQHITPYDARLLPGMLNQSEKRRRRSSVANVDSFASSASHPI